MSRGAIDALGLNYIPFEGRLDVDYFLDIPNRSVAERCLAFMHDQVNEIELAKRMTPPELKRMWLGTLRACIAHGVPLTPEDASYGKLLGVVMPG